MVELKAAENQNTTQKEPYNVNQIERRILVLCLLVLIISITGFLASDNQWIDYIFAHLGGVSIVGLLGCCAGVIARKKGYGYWNAFLLGSFLPIILGFIAVLLFQPTSCGGSVSLAVAVLIVIIFSLLKPRVVIK